MGANSSKINDFINNSFSLNEYDVIGRHFDEAYGGDIQIIKHKSNKKDIKLMKEYRYLENRSLENEIETLEKLIKINNSCPNLLKIFGFSHVKDSVLCGKIQKIYIISEYIEKNLMSETKKRFLNSQLFSEDEIYKLIENIIQTLHKLKQNNLSYDYLQSNSIFYSQNKEYKILLPALFNISTHYMEFMRFFNKEDFFLSPEALKNIKEKSIFINFDQYKSDVFVLGCIILESISKITCSNLIYLQNLDLNIKILEKALNIIKKKYSESLYNLLKDMVEENPEKRIGFEEIMKRIGSQIIQMNSNVSSFQMVQFVFSNFNFYFLAQPIMIENKQKIRLTHSKTPHNASLTECNL